MQLKFLIYILCAIFSIPFGHANDANEEKECQFIKRMAVIDDVECTESYSHFNANKWKDVYQPPSNHQIQIANFNLLKLKEEEGRIKRLDYLASIIAKWDLVSVLELLPLSKNNLEHNQRIDQFLQNSEMFVQHEQARGQYKVPGYIDLLKELQQKHGNQWALIISSRAQGTSQTTQEYVGFFYRADRVKPITNHYCQDLAALGSIACLAQFDPIAEQLFSRKPFVGSFQSGKFDFTILSTHVRFLPQDYEDIEIIRKNIIPNQLGVDNVILAGRFAEMKMILLFMDYLREEYLEKDVILVGDFNLEKKKQQEIIGWNYILDSFKGGELFGDMLTTISNYYGLAHAYDHIILDPTPGKTDECVIDGKVQVESFNFLDSQSFSPIYDEYILSSMSVVDDGRSRAMHGQQLRRELESYKTVKYGKNLVSIYDQPTIDKMVLNFEGRIFDSQSVYFSKYRPYHDLISDHLPIHFSCKTDQDHD